MNSVDRAALVVTAILVIAVGVKASRHVLDTSPASPSGPSARAVAIDDGDLRFHVSDARMDIGADGFHLKAFHGMNLDIGGTGVAASTDGATPGFNPIRRCGQRATCRLECSTNDCVLSCDPGTTCSASCESGGCLEMCAAGATCDFRCEGGGCLQMCKSGSTCKTSCSGGGCRP